MADNEFTIANALPIEFQCFPGEKPPESFRPSIETIEHKGGIGIAARKTGARGTQFDIETWSDFETKTLAQAEERRYYRSIGRIVSIKWRGDYILYDPNSITLGQNANFHIIDVMADDVMPVTLVGGIRIGAASNFTGFILKATWTMVMSD